MVVYAVKEGTVIWSDNNKTHKAGRVPLHEPLNVLADKGEWFIIERPLNISLPEQPGYPNYFVRASDTIGYVIEGGAAITPAVGITDKDAADAILTLLKWLKDG